MATPDLPPGSQPSPPPSAQPISQLISISLLRGLPQDLPYSFALARNLLLADVALHMAHLLIDGIGSPLPRIIVSLLIALGLPWALLHLRGRGERYLQTLTALVGTSVLLSLFLMPVALFASSLPPLQPDVQPSNAQLAISVLWLLAIAWQLSIIAHIYRHALDWPRLAAAMLAMGLFICQLGLDRMLFGTPS
jgi:hypothetical protein